ncbi:DUF3772 domain-containing protein [Sphingomonas beigongshangi]|uniref:DUF3772 domain-containing protein n=1 Tax=Sphingomonas beigongshangi TaxID=2782540 RepID=UPI001AED9729|nr:DUF3772 domain-containing protein [Sphingomonas beigongshangi]
MSWILRLSLALALLLPAVGARAQAPSPGDLARQIDAAEIDLRSVDRALDGRVARGDIKTLRGKITNAQQDARNAAEQLHDQLALVDARIAQLGPAPKDGSEAPDIHAQRSRLAQQHSTLDAAVKRGNLLGVEAEQLLAEMDRTQAEELSERITARAPSPLSPDFWRQIAENLPRDLRRITAFLNQGTAQIATQWHGGLPWHAIVGAILALVLLFPARLIARRAGQRFLVEDAPGRRVRRSANAMWRVAIGTLMPTLAAASFVQGLRWSGLLPQRWSDLLDALVMAAGFSGFTMAIFGALLMRNQASWRIAPIGDEAAARLRPMTQLLSLLAFVTIMIEAFETSIGASNAAQVATQAGEALLHLALIVATLLVIATLRARRAAEQPDAANTSATAWLGAATLLAWVVVIGAIGALLLGYVSLSLLLARMIGWTTVVGSSVYLLMAAVDDVATTLFRRSSRLGVVLVQGLGIRGSAVDQFGVLFSGIVRLALGIAALALLLNPFGAGAGVAAIFGRLGALAQGVQIGGIAISPGAILQGLLVLFVGLALVRAFMSWLENRYLPTTDLDGSGRNSVSLVARYVGIALAVIWALASLGIGVERIALLLSALSVGIGFGLQAITQNFVSGLILLAERPIKIGDLVRVGTDEGDVKRISVRSTEIELADHSTLIVPNSELITKSVLNKTLSNALGRIQLQFSVPLGTDADLVRSLVLQSFTEEPAVLDAPAPAAFIDGIANDRILFNCFAHVASARAAYPTRSAILLVLLRRFRERGIEIGTLPQKLEIIPPNIRTE